MSIPLKDSQLVAWADNADAKLMESPETWECTAEQASTFHTLAVAFKGSYAALVAGREDGTRSASMTAEKDAAKLAFLNFARPLYAKVQWSRTISDANKILLGVKVRKAPERIGAPTVMPGLDIVAVMSRTVLGRLHDSSSVTKRSKPPGVIGAKIYSFVGTEYPTDPGQWTYEGDCTKNVFEVIFPDSVAPGTTVWVCAAWYSRTGLTGPVCTPLPATIQFGMSHEAA